MYDIIIIGAGPAGLSAAIYARRANKKVLVIEAKSYGGQIINAHQIDNYPGLFHVNGFDFAQKVYNQAKELGTEFIFETVTKITPEKEVITNKNTYQAKAIIIATGALNKKLNLPNEKELLGKGISYCATCDGSFYKGKIVAVNGGGSHALADALYLTDLASKVYLICKENNFDENALIYEELKQKNVEFILNSNITKINGTDKLESVIINDNQELSLDGLFIAIGQTPQNSIFSNVVDVSDMGYIISEDGVHTKTPGIYVAGDARIKELRQLTTAVSDGSIAAVTAIKEMTTTAK